MRAITYAAFTIALIEYTHANERPHPGFAVLDTPLLAYREPESQEDDLSVKSSGKILRLPCCKNRTADHHLGEYLSSGDIKKRSQSIFFSKNPHQGRTGCFP